MFYINSSPRLQTSKDMITNIVSELNISNDYFTADIDDIESDIYPTASISGPTKLSETDTKAMTSYLTETESGDEIQEHKHCDICYLELKSVYDYQCYQCTVFIYEKLKQKTYLDLIKCQALLDTLD